MPWKRQKSRAYSVITLTCNFEDIYLSRFLDVSVMIGLGFFIGVFGTMAVGSQHPVIDHLIGIEGEAQAKYIDQHFTVICSQQINLMKCLPLPSVMAEEQPIPKEESI